MHEEGCVEPSLRFEKKNVFFVCTPCQILLSQREKERQERDTATMKPQSCKNKGRRFQQKVCGTILDTFPHLTDEDVRSVSMGAGGEDILLSPLARRSLPLSIECKCVERMNVWQCIEQAESNCPSGATPCLVFSKNRSKTYAVLPWEYVLLLMGERTTRGTGGSMPDRLCHIIEELQTFLPKATRED